MGIELDESDLFPLYPVGEYPYSSLKEHAEKVDEFFGFKIFEIEEALKKKYLQKGEELWIGLSIQSLQTPYIEIRQILSLLEMKPKDRIIDLGSAYGRMGFVVGKHYPEVSFLGIEKVSERLREGERCIARFQYSNVNYQVADLTSHDFKLPEAPIYFLYDFGSKEAIRKVLEQLKLYSTHQSLTVVGRGRASRDVIEQECPWLSQVVQPAHHSNFSIYKTA